MGWKSPLLALQSLEKVVLKAGLVCGQTDIGSSLKTTTMEKKLIS